ncbi:DUF2934 domain-containing protein [Aquabacter spiritensis]|nr:DUF2934 domain-containing protein [Aquabacter spiritensis]
MTERETRIREKAFELWRSEGMPEGREALHWEMASEIVGLEDAAGTARIPFGASAKPAVEPQEALSNTGEFPTLTDQGEMQPPKRR